MAGAAYVHVHMKARSASRAEPYISHNPNCRTFVSNSLEVDKRSQRSQVNSPRKPMPKAQSSWHPLEVKTRPYLDPSP